MHSGLGSKISPIFISDDEEDIQVLSPQPNSSLTLQYTAPVTRSQRRAHKISKQQAPPDTSSKKRKRKLEQSVGPSHHAPLGAAGPTLNRTKRLKRDRPPPMYLETDSQPFELDYDSYLATPMRSDHRGNDAPEDDMPALPAYFFPSAYDLPDDGDVDSPLLSSSEWVNSMARAAEPSQEMAYPSWQQPPPYNSPPPQGFPLEESEPLPEPLPSTSTSTLSNVSNSIQQPPPSPAKKIIGMPIEKDTDKRRGAFKNPPSTTFEGHGVTFPHVPATAQTLIMEQLPKTCRTPAFIRSWCEKACGSLPVFLAIDPSTAKALVELPSTALAKKAWGSPKLGQELSGLNSVALKGRPREDLIRVWWYQPSSPTLTFDRKELEEGEIEDEPAAQEVTPKETKKERKARLAKQVKEEKAKKREKAIAAAAALQKEKSAKAQAEAGAAMTSSSASGIPIPNPFSGDFFDASLPFMLPSAMSMHMPYNPNPIPPPISNYWSSLMPPFLPPMPTSLPPPLPPPPESQAHWDSWNTPSHGDGQADFDYPIDDDGMEIEDVDMELSSPVATTYSFPSLPHENSSTVAPSSSTPVIQDSVPDPLASRTSSHSSESHRGLPTPTPTPPNEPSRSSSVSSTSLVPSVAAPSIPTAPSEPRAMKNAPREPSFTKRSLLARQKELEERILRTKLELGRKNQQSSKPVSTSSQTPTVSPPPAAPVVDEVPVVDPSKRDLEQNLRQLVLASQKRRKAAAADTSGTSTPAHAASTANSEPSAGAPTALTLKSNSPASAAQSTQPNPSVAKASLDDMALSFLNETIQTLKPVSDPSPSLPVPVPVPITTGTPATTPATLQAPKAIPASTTLAQAPVKPLSNQSSLAVKRLQLEQNIAETKRLMDKLSKATTKQERDILFARIREISRNSQDDKSSAPPTPAPAAPAPVAYPAFLTAHIKSPWPDSIVGGGILILSDDEDEEDDA
ncbi:hypothetical protein D9758_002921 [Tetrapyrgos nigripes]|uniref:Uncharacterized protein n=1 Tax=Tetrapyrgos nigripes TaxID=182062 RepID=A0A8H5GQB9_9AGAR|nr:hypothetical protein D9758_002921 [Tetrapyrgos nigripes]